jgi:outer membrane protein OmpA-like peptidoglycan-associated protein
MMRRLELVLICLVSLACAAWAVDTADSVMLGSFPLRPEENPFSVVAPWPPRDVPVGSLRLDSELRLEEIFHRLQPPWTVTDQRCGTDCGVDKQFGTDSGSHRPWTSGFGDQLTLAMQARPTQSTFGQATVAYQTDYADRDWLPITDEHRMANEGKRLRVINGELAYSGKPLSLRAFSGIGHDGWRSRGDLFGFYPAQWNVEKYRNFSGRQVPRGGELVLNGGPLGSLTLEGGGELQWGDGPSFYALYENTYKGVGLSYLAQYEQIPWGDPGEHMQGHSVRAGIPLTKSSRLDLGLLYRPFRLGRAYTHVDEVAPGQGIEGSAFQPSQKTAQFKDAFGGEALYDQQLPAVIDDVLFRLQYLGRVAGNKEEFHTEATKKINRDTTGVFEFTYQAPLEDPVPFVFEGSPANPGAAVLTPRGQDDPFWVNWSNRKARVYAFTLTYNPSPTWFYRYTPNLPMMSNLNPELDVPFAWAVRVQASDYLTAIDHSYYVDQCGNYIWEPVFGTGARSTSRPLGEVQSIARFKLNPNLAMALEAEGGESAASSSLPYNDTTDTLKPITDYIEGQVRFFITKRYTAWFRYSRDLWGPYSDFDPYQPSNFQDFQRAFGITAHKLFEAGGEANLGSDFVLGIRYVSVRENDNIFVARDIGSFDEYRLSLSYRFGLLASFGAASPQPVRPVQKEIIPPEVILHVGDPLFDASGSKSHVPLHLKIIVKTVVERWEFQVVNSSGQTVGVIAGVGDPPEPMLWDGIDSAGNPLPAGTYQVAAQAWDIEGNKGEIARPETFELQYPARVIQRVVETVVVPAPPIYKVEQTEAGLKVTFKSSVLFGVNKSVLKPGAKQAINQVVKLIEAYPKNHLSVDGHADSTGARALNDRLSQARARTVAYTLVEKGIDPQRIEVHGWGFSRPAASNSTAEGRSLNRRVEITILKAKE